MARKKKNEIKEEAQPIITEEPSDIENSHEEEQETLIPTLFVDDSTTKTYNQEDMCDSVVTSPIENKAVHTSDSQDAVTSLGDYAIKIQHAMDVIETCNLYMWAGLDWGAGRIYEMARKEWSKYVLDMYEWSDSNFTGTEPEAPSELN